MNIEEGIQEIIDRYYDECDGCVSSLRYDDDENEFWMKNEIDEYLSSLGVCHKVKDEYGCTQVSYSNSFLTVAWIENGELKLKTILQQMY